MICCGQIQLEELSFNTAAVALLGKCKVISNSMKSVNDNLFLGGCMLWVMYLNESVCVCKCGDIGKTIDVELHYILFH